MYDANGERHRFSTRCTDRGAAELGLRREERIAQTTTNYREANGRYTLQNALDDLIERGCIDCAPDTVQFYRIKCGHLIRLLGSKLNLVRLSADRVREYIQLRRDEGAKDNTIIKELIALRRALKLAHERGLDPSKTARATITVTYDDLIDGGGPVNSSTRVFALWWGAAADF